MSEKIEVEAPRSGLADNEITERIIGAAIEIHRHFGPGLLESAYEVCLCYELNQMGVRFQRQEQLPIQYKGIQLASAHKMDLLVEDAVVVEIKSTEDMAPVQSAQLLTYLKFSGKRVGLLVNFNVPVLKDGLKRIVNRYAGPAISPSGPPNERVEAAPTELSSPSPRLRVSASNRVSAPDPRSHSIEDLS